jgi:hypothetical protein
MAWPRGAAFGAPDGLSAYGATALLRRFIARLGEAWRSFWRNKAIAPYFIVILSLGWVNRGV